jgi:hypothetical protein
VTTRVRMMRRIKTWSFICLLMSSLSRSTADRGCLSCMEGLLALTPEGI